MRHIPKHKDKNIISGIGEDVFAFDHNNETILQTVDLITPIVDDPYHFGAIAVANALSDIYAKGGVPKFALNIIEFPTSSLPLSILEEMVRGGRDKASEAGVSIVGGHTIDASPKYGMAVTGFLPKHANLIKKSGAKPGDHIFLTKPLGIGIYTTAIDQKLASKDQIDEVMNVMLELNKVASEIIRSVQVNACTDVTGFGLLGHLKEVAENSDVTIKVDNSKVPCLSDVFQLMTDGAVPEGILKNKHSFSKEVKHLSPISKAEESILYDPQTSGGLLIFVSPDKADELKEQFEKKNVTIFPIGTVTEKAEYSIETYNEIQRVQN